MLKMFAFIRVESCYHPKRWRSA